jgi:DNA invertase Pin-like site-specific DNA recombinase
VRKATTRKTIAYLRVSTQEQAQLGFSLPMQRTRIEAYAVATDRTIDDVIVDDGRSAKTLQRPGMQRLLDAIKRGDVATVIVFKLDRLTRSVRDLDVLLETLNRKDVGLVSVSEALDTKSAGGRMLINMLCTVAQWEREIISERTVSALAHKREARLTYGPTPMGYERVGDALIANDVELSVLRDMQARYASGDSYATIAAWLNATNVPARKGGAKWYPASVRRVLTSRMATEAA